MSAFPRIYQSFAEFERDELRRLDSLSTTVADLLEEHFSEENNLFHDIDEGSSRRGRGSRRRRR